MMRLRGESGEELEGKRFLVRHSSSTFLNIFGCCSSSSANGHQSSHPERIQPNKISIKNVIRKSGLDGTNGERSVQSSRIIGMDRREQNAECTSKISNTGKPFLGESQVRERSERTVPVNRAQKIKFVYKKEENDNSIHNYHTTNVIVEKYIVKPQEMNIFIKEDCPPQQDQDFHSFQRYQPTPEDNQWEEEAENASMESEDQSEQQVPSSNCHFSFGQHQRNTFINKFAGFREVCSNRPSRESVKLEGTKQGESRGFNFNRKQNLCNLVRNVEVMDEEDDSSSVNSEVIDSYQNIMSRIQQKSRIISLSQQ